MLKSRVQIVLLTHDRPRLVFDTIESILSQSYRDYSLIISDNSAGEETQKIIAHRHLPENAIYVRCTPNIQHAYNYSPLRFSEMRAEYFVIFHDDDLMLPEYLCSMVALMDSNPAIAAAGSNAYLMFNERQTAQTILPNQNEIQYFDDPTVFISKYLLYEPVAPYSSYIYRTTMLNGLMPTRLHGGKYSDAAHLMDILGRGKLAWNQKPLMYLRRHLKQDSNHSSLGDSLNLVRYVKTVAGMNNSSPPVAYFRRVAWCDWLKHSWRDALRTHPRRYWKVLRYMLPNLLDNKRKSLFRLLARSPIQTHD